MSRKPKSDVPPLKVVVDKGKLVPATAYDAERIDSYRQGTTFNVHVTPEKVRTDVIRWHSAISRAVKTCKTPWPTADVASKAIKLSLGLVEPYKSASGQWLQDPISLNDLDDADLEQAVRQLYDLLYRITGVDPAEWRRQNQDIVDPPGEPAEEPDGPGLSPPVPSEAGSGSVPTQPAAGQPIVMQHTNINAGKTETERLLDDQIPDFDQSEEERERQRREELLAREAKIRELRHECSRKMLATATDPDLDVKQRREILEKAKDWWKAELPADQHNFLRVLLQQADKVAKGELPLNDAKKYLNSLSL